MNSPVAPELQAAFNREREEARARKTVDAAAAREQTVRMYGRLAAFQGDIIAHGKVKLANAGVRIAATCAFKFVPTTHSCCRSTFKQNSMLNSVRA